MPNRSGVLTIGELARASGCEVPTIRYYETVGLLPEPPRSVGRQRLYGTEDVARLGFIVHYRRLGFDLATIGELLSIRQRPEQPCGKVTVVASRHVAEIEERIAHLTALRTELVQAIADCAGGTVDRCRVLRRLADFTHPDCAGAMPYPG